ncbi:MAG: hypothetical protein IKE74_06885 [Mogibacterium sp.]|nr:hypothetical protein [Mogibacterium sp.]
MKKRSLIMILITVMSMTFCLAACGGGAGSPAEEPAEKQEDQTSGTAAPEEIVVDAENHTVTITAQLNGTFFDQSTMHYCVWKDGGMGDKCMFAAYCNSQDFYNAMVEAGGEPWNTTTDKIADGEFTDGQKVDVTLTWEGQDKPVAMADTVKTAEGKPEIDMRFSGNQQNNEDCGSGCIACLNSCWAGITSNAAYGYNAIDSGSLSVTLDDSVMPEDGTDVQLTFTLK